MASTANPPPAAIIALAIAGIWYLTQRKAGASMVRTPEYGTNAALKSPAVQRYTVTPSKTVPVTGAAGMAANLLQGVAGLFGGRSSGAAAAVSASGLPAVVSAANAYGFDKVQPGTELENAYQFGGPSMGVYGSTGADVANGWKAGANAEYYGVVTNPETFTGDPYNDGGGAYDTVITNPPANLDWATGQDLNYGW